MIFIVFILIALVCMIYWIIVAGPNRPNNYITKPRTHPPSLVMAITEIGVKQTLSDDPDSWQAQGSR